MYKCELNGVSKDGTSSGLEELGASELLSRLHCISKARCRFQNSSEV
jgi:hypothetical protein